MTEHGTFRDTARPEAARRISRLDRYRDLMFGRARLIERRCDACGTAWLLTSEQARFSRRRVRRARGGGIGAVGQLPARAEGALALSAEGSQLTSEANEQLAIRSALRRCPKCQSEQFTDRKVKRANPASPDASRTELP
jgi:hypothetical protein